MHDRWTELDRRARELNDLDKVLGLLGWDEETYAPDRARPGRGRQNATLEAIRHQRLVEPALGELVRTFADDTDELRRMLARRLGRRRARALAVSERLVRAFAEARSAALASWQEAKRASRFELFAPHLERLIELSKERADALCTSEATAAGLPGTYRALLATTGTTAASRFSTAGNPWARVDDVILAPTAAGFLGTPFLGPPRYWQAALNVTAGGAYRQDRIWAGGATLGTSGTGTSCNGWSTVSATAFGAVGIGWSSEVASAFANYAQSSGVTTCDNTQSKLMCLQQ